MHFDGVIVRDQRRDLRLRHPLQQALVRAVEPAAGAMQFGLVRRLLALEQDFVEAGAEADEIAGQDLDAVGCEHAHQVVVIPFSGAAMANDVSLAPQTIYATQRVNGTQVTWEQPAKILPLDSVVREAILAMEENFNIILSYLEPRVAHLPSRVRSLIWVLCASSILGKAGHDMAIPSEVLQQLLLRIPPLEDSVQEELFRLADVPQARSAHA